MSNFSKYWNLRKLQAIIFLIDENVGANELGEWITPHFYNSNFNILF